MILKGYYSVALEMRKRCSSKKEAKLKRRSVSGECNNELIVRLMGYFFLSRLYFWLKGIS
jgi:hypothetical protein